MCQMAITGGPRRLRADVVPLLLDFLHDIAETQQVLCDPLQLAFGIDFLRAKPADPGVAFVFLSGKALRPLIPFLVIAAAISSATAPIPSSRSMNGPKTS